MIRFTTEADVPKLFGEGNARQSHFTLCDSPAELVDFATRQRAAYDATPVVCEVDARMCPMSADEAIKKFRDGDMRGVGASDKLLEQMERLMPETARPVWRDEIVGVMPNVPAFIAGSPMSMRKRVNLPNHQGAIAVVVDIGAASHVETEAIQKRGAAVLALVRALSAIRPVELWAGAGLDADRARNASWNFCRIDTAPLDLAHAAFILTNAGAIRRVLWMAAVAHGFRGDSPYSCNQRHATEHYTQQLIAPAFAHVTETIVLPRLTRHEEESISNPAKWIEGKIQKYGVEAFCV